VPQITLLQGTLDLLILRTLALGPLHGVGIADRIAQVTTAARSRSKPAPYSRLCTDSRPRPGSRAPGARPRTGRLAKLYTLTRTGQRRLVEREKTWARVALAIQQVLDMS